MYLCTVNNIVANNTNGMKNNGTFGLIDDLTITYNGNHLLKVTDDAEALNYNGALDFNDGDNSTCEYNYDTNGALTRDSNKGIKSITYDYGHHPYYINMNIGRRSRNFLNDYTPDGRKLSCKKKTSVSNGNGYTTITTTDLYVDDLMLRGDTALLWRFGGGYVELNANGTPTSWNYYITDHLGSTRMVVDSNDNIRETISYYPFGSEMRMENPALLTGGISHPFRFTGKELDRMHGLNMYDFGARWYDVAGVPMWTSVDPLCEKYYNVSPYNYCGNNPVNAIDPDGCDYNVLFDEENKTITISATYYANDESYDYAQQSATFWNNLSGKYSIDGMTVSFDLRIELCSDLNTGNTDTKLKELEENTPGMTNIFIFRERQRSDGYRNGVTYDGNIITILNDVDNKYLKYTGPHEMGHSLGLVHESTGLMTAEASNELRNENIYKSQIKSIVRNSYSGIPNEENGYSAGRGHFIPTNGKMPTTPKFKIKKL